MQPLVQELGNPKFTDRWGCYIATTKGDIAALENGNANGAALSVIADHVQKTYGFTDRPWVISNACASGTSAIAMAGAAIERGFVDHAVVIGVDVLSRFVLRGFQALHAVSEDPCLPFDAKTKRHLARRRLRSGRSHQGRIDPKEPDRHLRQWWHSARCQSYIGSVAHG
ncbi:MAG: hypothetical protein IPI00_10760 [Flavobacteriales bacterium]|nr:hypothetical protein [Flavobacteriales bacterium]